MMKSEKLIAIATSLLLTIGRIGYHHYFDKTTVLQEARVFNESPINARKCRALLTKILYLISLGETFGTTEATELFFSVTKLFQSKDVSVLLESLVLLFVFKIFYLSAPKQRTTKDKRDTHYVAF